MALASIATAPPADLPWRALATGYIAAAASVWLLSRRSVSGGVLLPGTLGDSRFILAVIGAVGIGAVPAESADVALIPFGALLLAAMLCGASDGAWIAMAMHHLKLTFGQALRTLLRASRSPGACTWRIVTGGRP